MFRASLRSVLGYVFPALSGLLTLEWVATSFRIRIFDTLLLSLLLYWTGGPSNPFSIFYLVHITLAAVVLGTAWTWCLTVFSSVCFGMLFKFHVPLLFGRHVHHQADSSLSVHLYGMLLSFIVTAVLIAYFLTKLTSRLWQREAELRELQLKQLTHQRLASLATLSAGAAHELSSPLSTIAVIAKELERNTKGLDTIPLSMVEDAKLIRSEVERCRTILDGMGAKSGQLRGEVPSVILISLLLQELKEELRKFPKDAFSAKSFLMSDEITVPVAGLKQALLAIIRNAFDATSGCGSVELCVREENAQIDFIVSDSGVGISEEIRSRIGEPFFTTKETGKGMGLGLFLVKLFADQWSGNFDIHSELSRGTRITLSLPNMHNETEVRDHA